MDTFVGAGDFFVVGDLVGDLIGDLVGVFVGLAVVGCGANASITLGALVAFVFEPRS